VKFKTAFIANAVPLLLEGLGLLIVPSLLVSLFGVTLTPGGVFMTRFFGAAMIGLAWMSYKAREADDSEVLDGVIQGTIIVWAVSAVIALTGFLAGTVNFMSLSTMGMGILFAVWFAYLRYGKK